MPLDLASLLGDGNSNQESIYSEIIELDDDSPVKSKNEVTTEITEVRPLDLNSLFTKSNGSEGSPSTSTNSEDTQLLNSETTMLEESDVIDEAHKLFQVSSSKPMKVRGAPRARAKKWKTMNPEEEREAIMKILRQL
ncbi:hypothetical protein M3Y97_00990800 [Aphelenchoides bicaudatus]|nr:hypothetical protein M3Y97_00990800 [Aphelenchoides bicaudatus]